MVQSDQANIHRCSSRFGRTCRSKLQQFALLGDAIGRIREMTVAMTQLYPHDAAPRPANWSPVPELTRSADIKLNKRVWLQHDARALSLMNRTISPYVRPHVQSRQAIMFRCREFQGTSRGIDVRGMNTWESSRLWTAHNIAKTRRRNVFAW
jgi:hypothetical protein